MADTSDLVSSLTKMELYEQNEAGEQATPPADTTADPSPPQSSETREGVTHSVGSSEGGEKEAAEEKSPPAAEKSKGEGAS